MRPSTSKPKRTKEYLELIKPIWELNDEVGKMVMPIWNTKTILESAFDMLNNEIRLQDSDYGDICDKILDLIESSIGIIDSHCMDLVEPGYWESLKLWKKYNYPTLKGSEGLISEAKDIINGNKEG